MHIRRDGDEDRGVVGADGARRRCRAVSAATGDRCGCLIIRVRARTCAQDAVGMCAGMYVGTRAGMHTCTCCT